MSLTDTRGSSGRNVKIYVENPSKIIVGREEEATQSPLLKKLISYDLSEGWSIMSPALSRFDSKAFEAVVEFLKTAEYTPRFLDENKASRRLENITTQSAKAAHVLNSRILYCIAGKIELQAMQNPILRKLKVLSPYPPSEFITIAGLIFQQGSVGDDEEIRQLLLKYMAEHYWQLQKKEPRQFMEVKTFFPELDASVTTRRAKGTKGEVALIKIEDE